MFSWINKKIDVYCKKEVSNSDSSKSDHTKESSIECCEEADQHSAPSMDEKEIIGRLIDVENYYMILQCAKGMDIFYVLLQRDSHIVQRIGHFYKCKGKLSNIHDRQILFANSVKTVEQDLINGRDENVTITGVEARGTDEHLLRLLDIGSITTNYKEKENLQSIVEISDTKDIDVCTESTNFETCPPSISGSAMNERDSKYQLVTAIVLEFAQSSFYMFSIDLLPCPMFRIISSRNMRKTLNVGKWYSIGIILDNQKKSLIPIYHVNEQINCLKNGFPIKSRIRNGLVQLLTEVVLSAERTKEGLFVYQFGDLRILDSSCIVNKIMNDYSHPRRKIKIWCSPRRFAFAGAYWKAMELKLSKKTRCDRVSNGSPLKTPKSINGCRNVAGPSKLIEGLICSQTADDFVVYSPSCRAISHLSKLKTKQGNLIGMWIQFALEDGRKSIDTFEMIEPIIPATPTHEFVLIRTRAKVSNTGKLYCEKLKTIVEDTQCLLKPTHFGREVHVTIGCGTDLVTSEASLIRWKILHVDQ